MNEYIKEYYNKDYLLDRVINDSNIVLRQKTYEYIGWIMLLCIAFVLFIKIYLKYKI